MDKSERFYYDTAENLIRWDKFHVADENWSKKMQREDIEGQSDGINLEASDLYMIEMKDCDTNKGKKLMFCVVDPNDCDVPHMLVTGLMHIDPKEPILIKRRNTYDDGPHEMILLLDKKRDEAETEVQKAELADLRKKIAAVLAREKGYTLDEEKEKDDK
jgi:hypothetical protein